MGEMMQAKDISAAVEALREKYQPTGKDAEIAAKFREHLKSREYCLEMALEVIEARGIMLTVPGSKPQSYDAQIKILAYSGLVIEALLLALSAEAMGEGE